MPERALRTALALFGAVMLATMTVEARPQEALSATVVQRGLYRIETTGTVVMPNGISADAVGSICHVATTEAIPAAQGVHFGFRFRIDGPPAGEPVVVRKVVRFPRAVIPPLGAGPIEAFDSTGTVASGAVSYTGYGLDYDWEIVPGPWTFEIFSGGRQLAKVTFMVTKGIAAPAGQPDGDDCTPLPSQSHPLADRWAMALHP